MSEHTIIGVADTHLRDTQYGYPSRGLDFSNSLTRIVDSAIKAKAEGKPISAILHSGDLLDNTRPSPSIIKTLNDLHGKLVRAGIPMYVISGNHDRTSPHWTEVLEESDKSCGIVCADHQLIKIPMGDTHLKVYGLPFCSKEDFKERLRTEVPGQVDVLMWHGAVQEFVKFPMESAISLADIPRMRFQACLIGDIHINQINLLDDDFTYVISPGSTEMCKSDEPLEKWVVTMNFSTESGTPRLFEVGTKPIKTRKFLRYKLVTEDDVIAAIHEIKENMDSNPVILMRVHPSLPNITSRLNVVVDRDKCILKIGTLPSTKLEVLKAGKPADKVKAVDLLHKFLPPGTKIYELGQLMTDPEINEKDALERYCSDELSQIVT